MLEHNNITSVKSSDLSSFKESNYDVIVINSSFSSSEINDSSPLKNNNDTFRRIDETNNLIGKAGSMLKNGGLIFVYGLPKYLPLVGRYLNFLELDDYKFYFKYWISVEFKPKELGQPLANSHLGVLMYLKSKKGKSNIPFYLNTKTVRVPYGICKACKRNLKDWGGKKHLMNPLGASVSDVWFEEINSNDYSKIPNMVLEKIYNLTNKNNFRFLLIEQDDKFNCALQSVSENKIFPVSVDSSDVNKVILGDSIKVMQNYAKKYPNGLFDLAFADPPYNLGKNYNSYEDEKRDYEYVKWCNEWIQGMVDVLKPGGTLMVLNIPKWAIFHAEFLLKKMEFRHWIVWDALSSPAGKIMPAHYALLYFTKPGGKIKNNFEKLKNIEARYYCNRALCKQVRKRKKIEDTEILSDIWKDIFRIKHKKDRDNHPCQLPLKLMERIIELTTDEGDVIYDPFGGAGTTALVAKLKKRKYVISEVDPEYVKIAENHLKSIQQDLNGDYYYNRNNQNHQHYFNNGITKREVEMEYMNLCNGSKNLIELEKLQDIAPTLHHKITSSYSDFGRLQKITRRMMEANVIARESFNSRINL